jgi:predicted nucleotidyltransferase
VGRRRRPRSARPLLFATVSGAHLYGFASVDSDLDLRAAHLLSPAEVLGLRTGPQTLQHTGVRDGVELDVVSHDLLKFARLLNSRNGYVLEQLLSPLVVVTTAVHAELRSLAPQLITRHHAHHYSDSRPPQRGCTPRPDSSSPRCTRCGSCSPGST